MGNLIREAAKYAAASAVALLADAGLLLALTRYAGWHYLVAAAVSFVVGATIAYTLSVKFVFSAHRLHNRELEFASFILIGLVGWAINLLVLFIAHGKLGIDLVLAKGLAASCTFLTNFALRRQLLFRVRALAV
ncbi:MAG TPA: GtrA family protein [Steroidobacteraceae bacterium]|nr:GtrA family protein [Steroidobacteraceae bacterium]